MTWPSFARGRAWRPHLASFALAMAWLCAPAQVASQNLDRFDEREDSGIYARSNQKRLDALLIGGMIGVALFEGTDSRLGRTTWRALDASITSALATEAMKTVFQRPRPSQEPDPNIWFAGRGHKSFPSGEVALMTSVVTPYIYEYRDDYPAVYGLIALPVYMGNARMKSQAHWLTDVLGGAAVGWGMGYLASRREAPLILTLTGKGVWVGWRQQF